MKFDVPTLMAAGVFTTAVSSLLLALAWLADRRSLTFLWWSAGNLVIAGGILLLLLSSQGPPGLPRAVSALLLVIGPALIWTATRVFRGGKPHYAAIAAGTACLIGVGLFTRDPSHNLGVNLLINAIYFGGAGTEVLRGRARHLRAHWPLAAFLFVHAALFAAGTVEAFSSLFPRSGFIPFGIVFSAVHFEQLIFALGSSIFLVAMIREESELRHKTAARIDVLTGVASRRAFFEAAAIALQNCARESAPLSLVIFDLDRFKQVNDTFGHSAGDHVLQSFGETAMARLRRSDIIGRLGGEEFAIAMPGMSPEAAYVVAERIRVAFSNAALSSNGQNVPTMVSGGVSGSRPGIDLDRLIESADTALYRAKTLGRNRIEVAPRAADDSPASAIVRVA